MANDRAGSDRRDREWGFSDLFETTGYRARPRKPDPVTGKLPDIKPPKGGSSIRPASGTPPKAPPKG